ncbi:MAG: transcription antitermination factor NusB [Patescibacteria group bacterium]|nr:transcription antitermination factor NusB [Patescibacteria group bacterium]
MANRHLSRSVSLQSLFEWDFNGYDSSRWRKFVGRNIEEFAPGIEDSTFIYNLVEAVIKQNEKLDLIITKAAPEWPIDQIAVVDRNVLRLGLYELLFADKSEVPARVAINEAIELAKTFGGENSGKFVNGVLGAIYKEMGEPGKDEVPAKKKRPKDVPYDQMPIEKLGGAVVYILEEAEVSLALVHDIFGYWTLSKGHLEEGEDLQTGTTREVKEEMSLDVKVADDLGQNEYISSDPEKGKLRKQVNYFLAQAKSKKQLKLKPSGGLDDARWFTLAEVGDLRMYDDVVPFITKAVKLLSRHRAT